jgi:hypothetical protein
MLILSHRGYWRTAEEKNGVAAFRRSFDLGFGTETDVRDLDGELVIAHDMPRGGAMRLTDFLNLESATRLPLAINIKADGLTQPLLETMRKHHVSDWFVFDMSIPDTRAYLRADIPVFLRMSEVESLPAWIDRAAGIWLDAFESTWYDIALVESLLAGPRRVCIVSSELHGRPQLPLWNMLRPLAQRQTLLLCTDFPEQARIFFESENLA